MHENLLTTNNTQQQIFITVSHVYTCMREFAYASPPALLAMASHLLENSE